MPLLVKQVSFARSYYESFCMHYRTFLSVLQYGHFIRNSRSALAYSSTDPSDYTDPAWSPEDAAALILWLSSLTIFETACIRYEWPSIGTIVLNCSSHCSARTLFCAASSEQLSGVTRMMCTHCQTCGRCRSMFARS
jgi:hypothetical protein